MSETPKCSIKGHGRLLVTEVWVSCRQCGEVLELDDPEAIDSKPPKLHLRVSPCTGCDAGVVLVGDPK
jgi:hypothetical protein